MTTYFKMIGQINTRADYEKILRKALATPGQEPFYYFDAYPFDKKEAPLVLVGDIAKSLIGDLKKQAPKAQYGTGVCTVTAQDEIIFERETGKLQPKLVSTALKLSGIKSTVKFNGEDEEDGEGAENEADEGQAGSPEAKSVAPPITAKPSGATSTPASGRAKEFQDKLKILRPAFDQALNKARSLKKVTWAEDLDANFAQMVQEAKAGHFDAALQTLARLARMVKGEEAARAEVKHQTDKEHPDYAEMHKASVREHASKQELKQARQGNKASGYGLTEDGNVAYALPLKPGEWKSGVIDKLDGIHKILSKEPVDFDVLTQAHESVIALVQRAQQHSLEGGDEHEERQQAIAMVMDRLSDLHEEIHKIQHNDPAFKIRSGQDILKENEKLRELIDDKLASPGNPRPSATEVDRFKQGASQRKELRMSRLDQQQSDLHENEKKLLQLAMALKEEAPELSKPEIEQRRRQLEQMKEALKWKKSDLVSAYKEITEGYVSMRELDQFQKGVRDPSRLATLHRLTDNTKTLLKDEHFQQAFDEFDDTHNALVIAGFGQDPAEQEILQSMGDLLNYLLILAQSKEASPQKAMRLAKRVKVEAEKAGNLLG
ncbi:hypothetical protein EIP75_09400 [Aquabacterium soli]|uniref:Uncharacterized protein n=1 Tax=Aquabacterium soli TaxID=2493092 RepID=A0A426VCM6_9BURK|nr:hypothetical protein [Aquabacterium soli]RRS04628.1 hypothetical protein EIP75_09400 [Aquabacterium soli]